MDAESTKTCPCFACLETIKIPSNQKWESKNEKEQNSSTWFCLKRICYYLKINPYNGGMKLPKGSILVPLCAKCTVVATKLSKLCEELELTQMKVNYYLKDFVDLLSFSRDAALPENQVRKRTRERCSIVLENSKARVILKRCKLKSINKPKTALSLSEPAPEASNENNEVYEVQGSQQDESLISYDELEELTHEEMEDDITHLSNSNKMSTCIDPLSPEIITNNNSESETNYGSKSFKATMTQETTKNCQPHSSKYVHISPSSTNICEFCELKFSNIDLLTEHIINHHQMEHKTINQLLAKTQTPTSDCSKGRSSMDNHSSHKNMDCSFVPQTALQCDTCPATFTSDLKLCLHKAEVHMDKKLESSKFAIISNRKFEVICKRVLKEEVENFRKIKRTSKLFTYECHYCFMQFRCSATAEIHLSDKHASQLSEKVVALQKEESETMFICANCKVAFNAEFRLRCHRALLHTHEMLMQFKLEGISSELFEKYCKDIMEAELRLFTRNRENPKGLNCSYDNCTETFICMPTAALHVLLFHLDIVKEKLRIMQVSELEIDKRKGINFMETEDCLFEASDVFTVTEKDGKVTFKSERE